MMKITVDHSKVGNGTRFTVQLFKEEFDMIKVGDTVLVLGDSFNDRPAQVVKLFAETKKAELTLLPLPS